MTSGASSPAAAAGRPLASEGLGIAVAAILLGAWSHVDDTGFFLGWVAFVPWLRVLDRERSLRAALASGWAMSVAFVLAVFPWFAEAVHGYTGAPRWLALFLLALAAPLLQPQFLALAAARRAATAGDGPWSFLPRATVAAAAYVGTEWAWPKLLGDTVGYGFWVAPRLRQAADAIGPHGLTFVLLLVNECVLAAGHAALTRDPARGRRVLAPLAVATAVLVALGAYGERCLRRLAPRAGDRVQTVAAVQAGIGDHGRLAAELGTYGAVRRVLDAHFALSEDALRRRPDLIVWPETIYPTTFGTPKSADGADLDREIGSLVARTGVPLVFGAYDADPDGEFNAAIVLERDAHGELGFDAYRKARLFPLTERVPALLEHEAVRRHLPWLGTWQPGSSANVFAVTPPGEPPVRIAPLICYDAVDAGLVRRAVQDGAELLVTISNDAWFASGDGPRQHFVVAGFRSIETRTPQVRATTTGISAVVSATGETLAIADVGARAVLVADVVLGARPDTLQLRWGDWFPPAALLAAAGLLVVARLRPSVASPPVD